MDRLPAVLRKKEDDVVKAGTFRLTLGAQTAAIVGALITGLDPIFGDAFSDGQQTAIIVAAIALIAVTQVADVLARAWATASASAGMASLPKSMAVSVRLPLAEDDYDGLALAARGDEYLVLRSGTDGKGASWVQRGSVRFR